MWINFTKNEADPTIEAQQVCRHVIIRLLRKCERVSLSTLLWRPKEAKPDSGLICGPKTETCKRSIEPAKAGSGMLSGTGL